MKKAKVLVLVCVLSVFAIVGQAGAACTDWEIWPGYTVGPPTPEYLLPPTNVTVTVGDGSITVSWSAVTGATVYKLMITDGTNIAWVKTTQTSYTFSGTVGTVGDKVSITNGKEYQIKVAGQGEEGGEVTQPGNYSSAVCATPTASATTTTTASTTTSTTASTTTSTTASTTTSTAASTTTSTTAATTTSTTAATTTSTTAPTTTSTTTTTTTLPALPNCAQMGNYKMDVNGDGKIDANDAALIIRYLKLNCQSQ